MTTFLESFPRGVDVAIRDSTPGYADACRAVERLAGLRPPVINHTNAHVIHGEVANRLLDRALSGDVTPDEVFGLAQAVHTEATAFGIAANAIKAAQEMAKRRRDELVDTSAYLAGYRDAFELLLVDLKALQPLSQIADAASALASQRIDDFGTLEKLTAAHHQMRQRHFKMLSDSTGSQYLEAAVFARAVPEFFEDWPAWRSHGYLVDRRTGQNRKGITPPWPASRERDTRAEFPHVAASLEFLVWAIDSGVDLWMPTQVEFERAEAGLRAARAVEERPNDGRSEWMDPVVHSANLRPRTRAEAEGRA